MRRFGVLVMQDAEPAELTERFRRVEALGFDQLYLADHMGDFRDLGGTFLDGWSLLAAAAVRTERIAIGTLVTNPILRAPGVLAKQALTVDQLARGRLELGIGAGVFEYDHLAVGSEPWSVRERVARFDEYVAVLDGALRANGKPYSYDGEWYRVRDLPTAPGPVRRPRPPIIVGGQAPSILRTTARYADGWNTNGQYGAPVADIVERTREQNRRLDELCLAAGRDPATLRRSMLLWDTTDPTLPGNTLPDLVARFTDAGIDDFVLGWLTTKDGDTLTHLAEEVIPTLR